MKSLQSFQDALVRVRGCLATVKDATRLSFSIGEIQIRAASIDVDRPAPADPFAVPAKQVAELAMFDPQASVFQSVKVAGQIIYARDGECFLMDGSKGLRFVPRKPVRLHAGDHVEVAGFPEFSIPSPMLREAVVRQTGTGLPPQARQLTEDILLNKLHDSMLVELPAQLVSLTRNRQEVVLGLKTGSHVFAARLDAGPGEAWSLPIGSQLDLTGVYVSQKGNRLDGPNPDSFELLLNSPADIRVLSRPSGWTLERLLFILGALACVLAVTVLWITQLHRKVEERSSELEAQIRERQRVEQQRTMEQERARIAQDLHDELGSGLTEVSMLGARARAAGTSEDTRRNYLEQMRAKAQDMVVALDEIVWAMNPRHDSLASLISYFSLYADRFLGLANIAWRLEDASGAADLAVDSRRRHQLFLAFKEALTNVVRHSGATEVRLNIRLENSEVRFAVTDNGRGLPAGGTTEAMDGIVNMRSRLEKAGGRFEVFASENRPGTTVCFFVPAK